MKQFALIGLSTFGRRVLEELLKIDADLLIIDKDPALVDRYKDQVGAAYVADVIREETIKRLVPAEVDAAIIDLGGTIEASVLVTNYLKKLGVKQIIARAETDDHGEILGIVGATQIIFPNREAAKRIIPPLVTRSLFNYLPLGDGIAIVELRVPDHIAGKTLVEADLRRRFRINVIARKTREGRYDFFTPDYQLQKDETLLVVGKESDITDFSGTALPEGKQPGLSAVFRRLFSGGD
jgi:trk system potassium uptake protein TrkA